MTFIKEIVEENADVSSTLSRKYLIDQQEEVYRSLLFPEVYMTSVKNVFNNV